MATRRSTRTRRKPELFEPFVSEPVPRSRSKGKGKGRSRVPKRKRSPARPNNADAVVSAPAPTPNPESEPVHKQKRAASPAASVASSHTELVIHSNTEDEPVVSVTVHATPNPKPSEGSGSGSGSGSGAGAGAGAGAEDESKNDTGRPGRPNRVAEENPFTNKLQPTPYTNVRVGDVASVNKTYVVTGFKTVHSHTIEPTFKAAVEKGNHPSSMRVYLGSVPDLDWTTSHTNLSMGTFVADGEMDCVGNPEAPAKTFIVTRTELARLLSENRSRFPMRVEFQETPKQIDGRDTLIQGLMNKKGKLAKRILDAVEEKDNTMREDKIKKMGRSFSTLARGVLTGKTRVMVGVPMGVDKMRYVKFGEVVMDSVNTWSLKGGVEMPARKQQPCLVSLTSIVSIMCGRVLFTTKGKRPVDQDPHPNLESVVLKTKSSELKRGDVLVCNNTYVVTKTTHQQPSYNESFTSVKLIPSQFDRRATKNKAGIEYDVHCDSWFNDYYVARKTLPPGYWRTTTLRDVGSCREVLAHNTVRVPMTIHYEDFSGVAKTIVGVPLALTQAGNAEFEVIRVAPNGDVHNSIVAFPLKNIRAMEAGEHEWKCDFYSHARVFGLN